MKLACWNVNGYRAIAGKGFAKWFEEVDADVVGLQEVKGHKDAIDPKLLEYKGYKCFWNAAKKPGYSGTAFWTRVEPENYVEGIGHADLDHEGRAQILEFKDFFLLNCYFPNSQDERARLKYKLLFNDEIQKFCTKNKKKKGVIVQGDFNVAHTELDIKNAKTNQNTAGFYIEERDWMTGFLKSGMHDVYRERHVGEPGQYTWWSYRANARANNVGWRIDYHIVSPDLVDRVKNVEHQRNVHGSDHCPIILELKD